MIAEGNYILALDVSTTTIGIAIFEDLGNKGKLTLLHHVSPKVKPKRINKYEEMFEKVRIFEQEFLTRYKGVGITKVIIEEPLLGSNNINTVATLLRFNGMIARAVYEILGVTSDFIGSYDARKYAFPELMQKRTHKRNGEALSATKIEKANPVLFGGYPFEVDKKQVVFEKVSELEPKVSWLYNPKNIIKKECYDMADAYAAGRGFMRMSGLWD